MQTPHRNARRYLNHRPYRCEAIVLTTKPPCCPRHEHCCVNVPFIEAVLNRLTVGERRVKELESVPEPRPKVRSPKAQQCYTAILRRL